MPTYVYRCSRCGRQAEHVQPITDETRPFCFGGQVGYHDEVEMERVIQPTMFILKGSRWAKDGYSK